MLVLSTYRNLTSFCSVLGLNVWISCADVITSWELHWNCSHHKQLF